MNAKAKLITAIAVLVIGLGGIVGTIWGVIAANIVDVNTPIRVGWTSHEVAVKVSATYQVTGRDVVDFVTEDGNTSIVFDGSETGSNSTKGFIAPNDGEEIALDNNASITFTFTITNKGDKQIVATLDVDPQSNYDDIKNVLFNTKVDGEPEETSTMNIDGNQTRTFTVIVSVDQPAKDARFFASFNWDIREVDEIIK